MSHPLSILVSPETRDKFSACVHCGLCLPACPTYVLTGDEADSPRGRIYLMKAAVDGRIQPSESLFEHLDRCLVCRACEPACPSGVHYHELIEAVRPQVARAVLHTAPDSPAMRNRLLQRIVSHLFPYAKRVSWSVLPLKIARAVGLGKLIEATGKLLPEPLGAMSAMLPDAGHFEKGPPEYTPALGERRGRVLLLQGCVGSVVSKSLNRDCATVLAHNGFDVFVLALGAEPCCGAMAAHSNDPEGAREFARQLVDVLATHREDFFVSPIAGCGAQLKSLHHVLADAERYTERAATVVKKMRDITELLAEVGLRPPAAGLARTVTYHDPCHLLNAQRIADAPRHLLRQIPGLKLAPLFETDLCCGAAGTYNLSQPNFAEKLGDRKAANIAATGATEVITANVGCQLQMERSLKRSGNPLQVRHVIEILAEAYRQSP